MSPRAPVNFLKSPLPIILFIGVLLSPLSPFSLIHSKAFAATYYVDATNGNDVNNGFSPETSWKTIAKVNAANFNPGDQILFKRGEIWRETLIPPSSGGPGTPIIFGAYGSGNKPAISGTNPIILWTPDTQRNTWMATVTTEPKIVLFNSTLGIRKTAKANLNAENDWYWAVNTLCVYSTSNPNIVYSETGVQAGSRNLCVYATKDYITLQNLTLRGSNLMGVQLYNAKHVIMDGCAHYLFMGPKWGLNWVTLFG